MFRSPQRIFLEGVFLDAEIQAAAKAGALTYLLADRISLKSIHTLLSLDISTKQQLAAQRAQWCGGTIRCSTALGAYAGQGGGSWLALDLCLLAINRDRPPPPRARVYYPSRRSELAAALVEQNDDNIVSPRGADQRWKAFLKGSTAQSARGRTAGRGRGVNKRQEISGGGTTAERHKPEVTKRSRNVAHGGGSKTLWR
ncbi:unnamed protein product [Amoebophrya sp. A120]|nr:unnamed protein product [Amoebophrya sp. A120]|eukprot:GSA120T00011360001.1